MVQIGFPGWLSFKESACNAGATGNSGSIPGSGRSPEGSRDNPLQYSCLENPKAREAWQAMVCWLGWVWQGWVSGPLLTLFLVQEPRQKEPWLPGYILIMDRMNRRILSISAQNQHTLISSHTLTAKSILLTQSQYRTLDIHSSWMLNCW